MGHAGAYSLSLKKALLKENTENKLLSLRLTQQYHQLGSAVRLMKNLADFTLLDPERLAGIRSTGDLPLIFIQ